MILRPASSKVQENLKTFKVGDLIMTNPLEMVWFPGHPRLGLVLEYSFKDQLAKIQWLGGLSKEIEKSPRWCPEAAGAGVGSPSALADQ